MAVGIRIKTFRDSCGYLYELDGVLMVNIEQCSMFEVLFTSEN